MNNNKGSNFFLLIIAIITGNKLIQHTDFKNFRFEKPFLDIIYLIVFLMAVCLISYNLFDYFKHKNK
jgi:hypothetical protein